MPHIIMFQKHFKDNEYNSFTSLSHPVKHVHFGAKSLNTCRSKAVKIIKLYERKINVVLLSKS